jgi:hypothetical protein
MVLTEDSSTDAYDTVLALVKEILKLLVPAVQTHRIDFTPLKDANARQAMHANLWKSTNPRDRSTIVQLVRSIITELLKDDGFVLYHIDGDRPWSAHESSENVSKFQSRMLPPIEAGVRSFLQRHQREGEHGKRMKRLLLLVPFFSIEAWLYQNTREARRLCDEQGCRQCAPKLSTWEQDRASLDEVPHPKEALCLRDRHNAHLASSSFPAQQVLDANASFARTVEALLACDALTSALQRTYAATPDFSVP